MATVDKDKNKEYNRRYYETHKADIMKAREGKERKPVAIDPEAHRKAAREYYHRKKASMTPEEREARNAKRRLKRKAIEDKRQSEEVEKVKIGQENAIR